MRAGIAVILTLGLIASPFTSPVEASIKPGSACKTAKNVVIIGGTRFTCTNSKKKMIWSREVGISNSKPITSPKESKLPGRDSRFKYQGDSCNPDQKLAPQLQWYPGILGDGTKTFLMCNASSSVWDRIGLSQNKFVSLPLEEPSLTEILPGATFRLSNPSTWDSISSYMQKVVSNTTATRNQNEIVFQFIMEPGDNGPFADEMKDELNTALDFYSREGLAPKYKEVYIVLGRSQKWIEDQVSSTCHPGWNGIVDSGNAVGTCELGANRGELILNIPGIATGYGASVDSDISLSKINRSTQQDISVRLNAAHEFFHLYQWSSTDSNSSWYQNMPLWFTEGSPQVMGMLAISSSETNSSTNMTYLEVFKKSNPALISAPGDCTRATMREMDTTPGAGCQYSLGVFAIETLMANFGGFDVIKNLVTKYHGGDFSTEFLQVTGTTLEKFYDQVDAHAKTFGYEHQ